MGLTKAMIEIVFIIMAFRAMQKLRIVMLDEIENAEESHFFTKWFLHLFLLAIYLICKPSLLIIVAGFLAIQIVFGLWLIKNKESYLSFAKKLPKEVEKILPIMYIAYFAFNLLRFLFI